MKSARKNKIPNSAANDIEQGSRDRILEIALQEFSKKGFSGARVARIAERASTSKHMLYYHFDSKIGLYEAVLQQAYEGFRIADANIDVDHLSPVEALKSIVAQSFNYHFDNEMLVRLVMNENIQHAKHITNEQIELNRGIIDDLAVVLERGQRSGVFRPEVDPKQLHLTISALGFHFVSNKYTFSKIFEIDMTSAAARAQRRDLVADIVLRWCAVNPESP